MPLREREVKALLRILIDTGKFISPGTRSHARREMNKDNLDDADIVNVLRGGVVQPAEWENGDWRYRVLTQTIGVVVTFDPAPDEAEPEDIEIVVVTAWRIR